MNSWKIGAWRSLAARLLWEQEVASSNLAAPTCKALRGNELRKAFFVSYSCYRSRCYAGATLGQEIKNPGGKPWKSSGSLGVGKVSCIDWASQSAGGTRLARSTTWWL